jgi:CubicO group peptidase (beta-lactamase class C family)
VCTQEDIRPHAVRHAACVAILSLTLPVCGLTETSAQYSPFPEQTHAEIWPTRDWVRARPRIAREDALSIELETLASPGPNSARGLVHAVVVVQSGQIVYERFREGHSCDQIEHTMSVAKMMGAVLAGLLVGDGALVLDGPVSFEAWPAGDPRRRITLRHLLNMTSGLEWHEDNDFMELAFGGGATQLAEYTAAKPLAQAPGTHYQYSDGTPSLVGELARIALGGSRSDVAGYVRRRLLEPVGMLRTELEFDRNGTWYGSSGVRWSACDLARFGLLLARDGRWASKRLLPTGWIDFMRTPSAASLRQKLPAEAPPEALIPYGGFADVYLEPSAIAARATTPMPIDAFGHYGWGGSHLRVVPSKDLVIVIIGERNDDPLGMLETFAIADRVVKLFPSATHTATAP